MKIIKKLSAFILMGVLLIGLVACGSQTIVQFDSLGGSEVPSIVLDGTTIPQFPEDPVKEGYTFMGWYYDEELSLEFGLTDLVMRSLTLYAKWEIITYTVTVDVNGVLTTQEVEHGAAAVLPESPTKEGYAFARWTSDVAGETDGTEITAEQTITAVFDILQYTVSFMIDGVVVETQTVNHGGSITVTPDIPQKEGMNGVWDPITDLSNVTSNRTITAVYSDKVYVVTFKDSFGTDLGTQEVTHGNKATAPEAAVIEGYDFVGWTGFDLDMPVSESVTVTATYQIQAFTVVFYGVTGTPIGTPQNIVWNMPATAPTYSGEAGYVFTGWDQSFANVKSNLEIHAQYTLVSYTVTFDENEGSTVADITAEYLSTIAKPADPTRSGYHFTGWFTDEACTPSAKFVFTEQTMMPLDGQTLYAGWEEASFTVSFHANGGSAVASDTIVFQDAFGYLPESTKTGYTLAGWYLDPELTAKVESTTVFATPSDITLYAKWTVNSYTITFDSKNGTTVPSITKNFGTAVAAPSDPTRVGHTFAGWYTEAALTNAYTFSTIPASDLTLYAKWTVNSYTITFDSKSGTAVTPVTQNFGTAVLAPTSPTREGYNFVTWCSDPDATVSYTFTTIPASDIILYAKWAALTDIRYTVEYYALNLDGTTYSLLETNDTFRGSTDSLVSISGKPITGYAFDSANVLNILSGTIAADGSLVLKVYYTRNTDTAYQVEFYQQNISDDNFTLVETKNLTATTGETVTATMKIFEGFAYESGNSQNVATGEVLADGTLVLRLFYTRNTYTVTLDFNDESDTASLTVRHGGSLSALPTPTRTGYTFQGWINEVGVPYNSQSIVLDSMTLYAMWKTKTFTVTINRSYMDSTGLLETSEESFQDIVAFGTTYYPVYAIEGYDFQTVLVNGVNHDDANFSMVISENTTFNLEYKLKTITITFIQNPTGSETVSTEVAVDYNNAAAPSIPALTARSGYTVVWDHTLFTHLTQDLTVHAIYYQVGVKSLTFMEGTTIIDVYGQFDIYEWDPVNQVPIFPDQILTADSPIWNLSKEGYAFLGWFHENGTPVTISEMYWSQISGSLVIYAHWQLLPAFEAPVITDVVVTPDTQTVSWTQSPLGATYPNSYLFLIDGVEYSVPAANCTLNAQTGVFSTVFTNGVLAQAGTHTIRIKALGNGTTNQSGAYSQAFTKVIEAASTGDLGEVIETKVYDYFIIEKTTTSSIYYFYTDLVYSFSSTYTLNIIDGAEFVTAANNKLTTSGTSGSFRFTVTTSGGTKTYYGVVIPYINQFALGPNLSNYSATTLAEYEDSVVTPYQVGAANKFHFDLSILDNSASRIDDADCILDYTFYLVEGSTETLLSGAELTQYVAALPDHEFDFTSAAAGKTFKVVISPKYQANMVKSTPVSFTFQVNGGTNVFTNEELQLAFADFAIENINIHANIVAELRPEQLNADGSPKNGHIQNNLDPVTGLPTREYGSVYQRAKVGVSGDNLLVNGNYFTIDGSDLPFINVHSDPDGSCTDVGFAESFEVVNVQLAIFHYFVFPSLSSPTNDNSLTMNNLTVYGNTVTPSVNYSLSAEEIASAEALMSRNSGGFCGVMVRGGSSYLHNLNVGFTTIAFFNTTYGTSDGTTPLYMTTDHCHAYDSWANSYYGYGITGFNLIDCNVEESGGAAIHVEDVRSAAGGVDDPFVGIDAETEVNNWVSGQEAWFKAYAMTQTVTYVKSSVEAGISALEKSILETRINPVNGLETEMVNFVLLSMAMDGAKTLDGSGNVVTASQVKITASDANAAPLTIARSFDFMATDPRDANNSFAFAVSPLSGISEFGAAVNATSTEFVTTLMGKGYDYNTAVSMAQTYVGNLVFFQAFYNITSTQAINAWLYMGAGYTTSVRTAITAVCGGTLPAQPGYIEVVASVGDPGNSTILLGLAN